MVYTACAITPVHDLMVIIALSFFLIAVFIILEMLYSHRSYEMFSIGIVCLGIFLTTAVLYYGNLGVAYIPFLQKLTFALCTGWLFAVQTTVQGRKASLLQYENREGLPN